MCEYSGAAENTLAAVLASIQRLRSTPRPGRTPAQLGEDLIALRHAGDLLELAFAEMAAVFARTDEYEKAGHPSPVAWIRNQCRTSVARGARAVCVGEQAASLPQSVASLEAGRISFDHLAMLAQTAQAVRTSPTARPFDEARLLRKAEAHTLLRFGHDCAHLRHATDAEAFLDEHVAEVQWRRLELRPFSQGGMSIRGVFDAVGAATLRSALEPLARRSGTDDCRDRERRLADALVELAGHRLDAGVLPQRGGQRPHLQVTASLETLMGLEGAAAGELEFSPPIPTATVQRLGCDATVVRVLLDARSAVIDVGRARRLPSGATRRALNVRDRGCVWPGCDRSASWTSAHHLRHWAHGGPTSLDNLVLLCAAHHWRVHEGGWQVVRTAEGIATVPPQFDSMPRAPNRSIAA